MRTVYRCVSADGSGLYQAKNSPMYSFETTKNHPLPCQDPMLTEGLQNLGEGSCLTLTDWPSNSHKDTLFGFNSIAQITQWLSEPKMIQALDDAGFKIRKLKVPNAHMLDGDFQVIYNCLHATTTEETPIGEFFDVHVPNWTQQGKTLLTFD